MDLIKRNIADVLIEKIDEKRNPCVVGLDPDFEKIPKHLIEEDSIRGVAEALRKFCFEIIDNVYDLVPAVKPQIGFFEKYGSYGVKAFEDIVNYARSKGLVVIEDGKRNDIGNTSQAYADGHLGEVQILSSKQPSLNVDLLTINPYLGDDALKPFISVCKNFFKGVFVLAKTSNPSSKDFQDRLIEITDEEENELLSKGIDVKDHKTQLYNVVGLKINSYAQELIGEKGYSPIGAVVGAKFFSQAQELRKIMPNSIFLVPGYGAQGGTSDTLANCFNDDGYGAVINSARGINYAYMKTGDDKNFGVAAREATKEMIGDILEMLRNANKFPKNWN